MAKQEGKKEEEKFELDSAGQALGYISSDQARVLAMEHSRDNRDFYGRRWLFRWLRRLAFTGAVAGWMGLIFYLSSLSQAEASRPLEAPVVSWLGELRSLAAHLVLYGVLAALVQASLWSWRTAAPYQLRWALAAAAFAAVYGVSDEYHQSLVPGRTPSLFDILANGVGALAAVEGMRHTFRAWSGIWRRA